MFKTKKEEGAKYPVPNNITTTTYSVAAEDGGYVVRKISIDNGYVTQTTVFPADVFAIAMANLNKLIRSQLEI